MPRETILCALVLLALLSVVYAIPAQTQENIRTEISEPGILESTHQHSGLSKVDHQTEVAKLAHDSEISKSDHQFLPVFVTRGCQIRSGSRVVASCHAGELCRYTCRCHVVRKDRFSIICGVRPPLYLGAVHRTRAVVRIRGGSVYSDSGRRCGC